MEIHTYFLGFLVSIISILVISNSAAANVRKTRSVCPEPDCAPPPKDACIKPKYTLVNGELCPDCYYIVKCAEEPVLCLWCCGPPPCCNDCGLDKPVPEIII